MTRGRRPLNAMDEALEIGCRRGSIESVSGKRDNAFDFIIIEPEPYCVCESKTLTNLVHVPA